MRLVFAILCCVLLSSACTADSDGWLRFVRPIAIGWSEQPLADGLQRLAAESKTVIWLDRRIDPGTVVTIQTQGPLHEAVASIAATAKLQAVAVSSIIVIAKETDADRIASSIAWTRIQAARTKSATRLNEEKAIAWPLLTTPREICELLASRWQIPCDTTLLPHDLWRSADYAKLDATAMLALLGGGFELRPELNRLPIGWTKLPERIEYAKRYSNVQFPTTVKQQSMKSDPQANWQVDKSGTVELTATASAHQWLELAAAGRQASKTAPAVERLELEVRAKPARTVISTLAGVAGWKLNWQAADTTGERLVTFHLKNATAETLIAEVCRQANCSWSRNNDLLTISDAAQTTNQ